MKKSKKVIRKLAAIVLYLTTIVSCSKNGYDSNNNPGGYPAGNPSSGPEIMLQANATQGKYLVDKDNRSLYYFSNDPNGMNNCTGSCELFWPVFNIDNLTTDKIGQGLNAGDFGSVTAQSGKKQITYKGWPLYYYAPLQNGTNQLESPGSVSGDGVDGIWFLARPEYSVMIVNGQLTGLDGKNYKSNYAEGIGTTTYFTDGNGRTLYIYSLDGANKNNFTKADLSNNGDWPVYENNQGIIVPSSLNKSDFGTINTFGKNQITYKGWPLYYFGQDGNTRGSNKGISTPQPGIWRVPFNNLQAAP